MASLLKDLPNDPFVVVIGGGPAGLRAAEVAALAGARVTLYDGKPSVGRKFLVAGKSGLNLTNAMAMDAFGQQYSGTNLPPALWRDCLADFDSSALREWAAALGVGTFTASSGKVFPTTKKAAPLLRRWVLRLRELGVTFEMNHRWVGLRVGQRIESKFLCRGTAIHVESAAVVLALGGGSWPQTGSDGGWETLLQQLGVEVAPLQAANCGWECAWSSETRAAAEGQPLHNLSVRAGDAVASGELMVTRYGLEGTLIYTLGPSLRAMAEPELVIDFKPSFTLERLIGKMESARRDFIREAQLRWKLPEAACALIGQYHGDAAASAKALAHAVKNCRIPVLRPRPLAEAISSAGGVAWDALDSRLMLKKLPGVYCAGEMIDWEAPTGGFLIQGCFATGTLAGRAAAS